MPAGSETSETGAPGAVEDAAASMPSVGGFVGGSDRVGTTADFLSGNRRACSHRVETMNLPFPGERVAGYASTRGWYRRSGLS